ncbi:MAG: 30S ribosome-binding factor RbfA [Chloroflexota bacterium]|nr:30S ribosome-binding factor RbfA [Chloroflexota bacterium]MDE2951405.1 30S ribosome-binding factor RbfA [Chloroflexota bacterium]
MSIKQGRMSDRIQQILSQLLVREIADPRLQGITVTEVKLDPELMVAKIYVSAMGDESRQDSVMAGLRRANGFLRREVGKVIRLRNTPELHFHWDHTLEHASRINQLIANLDIPPESESGPDADN